MKVRSKVSRRISVVMLAVPLLGMPVMAGAQNTGMQELLNRVERMQRELSTLQRQVYRGEAPPAAASGGQPGPSSSGSGSAGRNSVRINQLEGELQRLTGLIEQIDFRTGQIQSRLEKLVSDMDQRLTALEGGTVDPAAAPTDGLPLRPPPSAAPAQATPRFLPAPPAPPANASPQTNIGAPPSVLGTIPKNLAVSRPRGPAQVAPQPSSPSPRPAAPAVTASAAPASALPAGTPQEQYDYALSLMLKQQDFAKAETALKAFIEQNPKDKLAGNAYYWLGETYYVRQSYQEAAFSFAEGFQTFPDNNKAPDSLLKLGMSLDRLEKRKEACTAYSRLLTTYPKAAPRLKARVQREQQRAKCR